MTWQIWFQNRRNTKKRRPQKTKVAQNFVFNLKGRTDFFIIFTVSA